MSSYDPMNPAYQAARYGGVYIPAPTRFRIVEPQAVTPDSDDLTDLIGVHPAWMPQRKTSMADSSDLAMMMLQEKADLGKITVGSLVYQIIQREQIKETNLTRIAYQETAIDGQILRLERAWMPGQLALDNRMKAGLEAELLRLEKQKLTEETDCWRDIARLKEKLLEALALYRDSARRERMVAGGMPIPAPTAERG